MLPAQQRHLLCLLLRAQTRTSSIASLTYTFEEELYDAYGKFLLDAHTDGATHARPDPVGFGGQWGYYNDTEMGLVNLTHRYL